jgi:hypothetical protein
VGCLAKPTQVNSKWHVEHVFVPQTKQSNDNVSLLLFDFSDGANVSDGEEHVVISLFMDRLQELGVSSSVPLAASLEAATIRVAIWDNSTAVLSIIIILSHTLAHHSFCDRQRRAAAPNCS